MKAKFGMFVTFHLLKDKILHMEKYEFKNRMWEIKN